MPLRSVVYFLRTRGYEVRVGVWLSMSNEGGVSYLLVKHGVRILSRMGRTKKLTEVCIQLIFRRFSGVKFWKCYYNLAFSIRGRSRYDR